MLETMKATRKNNIECQAGQAAFLCISIMLLFFPLTVSALGWQKSLGLPSYPYVNMQPTSDDGLLNSECADNNCYTANVVKYAGNGRIEWKTPFSLYSTTNANVFINKMIELKDDAGYIIIYSSINYSTSPDLYYYRYARLNMNGSIIYDRPITAWNGNATSLKMDSLSQPEIEYNQTQRLFYKTVVSENNGFVRFTKIRYDSVFNFMDSLNVTTTITFPGFTNYSMPYFPFFKGKGNYFYILYNYSPNFSSPSIYIAKVDASNFSVIYNKSYANFVTYDFPNERAANADVKDEFEYKGDLVLSGRGLGDNVACPTCRFPAVLILDSLGNQKHFHTITSTFTEFISASMQINDSLILQLGMLPDSVLQRNNFKRLYNIKSSQYESVLTTRYGSYDNDTLNMGNAYSARFAKSAQGNIYYSATVVKLNSTEQVKALVKSDVYGNTFPYYIKGNVYGDLITNCTKDAAEQGIREYNVKAYRSDHTYHTSTDSAGNYELGLDTLGYKIGIVPNINYPLWVVGACAVNKLANVSDTKPLDTINFGLNPLTACTNLFVDISTPFLRRCFPATYSVYYRNNGTLPANSTYIDVVLDKYLIFNSASIPYQLINPTTYRFQIGDVAVMQSGAFNIGVTVDCDSTVVGQTHCVEAHIYPDTVCVSPLYNGPVINAFAKCKGDTIEFKLKNVGGDMTRQRKYIIMSDDVMRQNNIFQIPRGGEIRIPFSTGNNGQTYRIEAQQDSLFPPTLGDRIATAYIEGCRLNSDDPFSTGYVTQYPEYDGEPFRSIDCQQNRSSFDPNEKTGYPVGYDTAHYILPNTAIEYKIDFQNTGNDTAFNIVIYDRISSYLDINTLHPESSSFQYTFQRLDSSLVRFVFENINLLDSVHNEPLSHGFVKFNIQQKPDNIPGTIIKNSAAIVFDRNQPVITNVTKHTVGVNFLRIDIIQDVVNSRYELKTAILYPNPFSIKATLAIIGIPVNEAKLTIMDERGNIIQENNRIMNNQFEIDATSLSKGIYLYNIMQQGKTIAAGKMIIQ